MVYYSVHKKSDAEPRLTSLIVLHNLVLCLRATFIVQVSKEKKSTEEEKKNAYLPFISSVGQSLKPQGISVVPTIRPNTKPNKMDMNIPVARAINPDF